MNKEDDYIKARKSQLHFYMDVPLFTHVGESRFVLYKPSGITLGDMRMEERLHPDLLYIKSADKLRGLQEAQKAFNSQLDMDVKSGNPENIKDTLITIVNGVFPASVFALIFRRL